MQLGVIWEPAGDAVGQNSVRSPLRPTRCLLGRLPDLAAELARREAEGLGGRIAYGEDAVTEDRKARRHQATLEEAIERFTSFVAVSRPQPYRVYRNFLNGPLASWKARCVVELTKDQIGARHRALTRDHGPITDRSAHPDPGLEPRRAAYDRHSASQLGPWFAAVEELRADPERLGVTDTQGALVADYLTLLPGMQADSSGPRDRSASPRARSAGLGRGSEFWRFQTLACGRSSLSGRWDESLRNSRSKWFSPRR